jgi:AAA domain
MASDGRPDAVTPAPTLYAVRPAVRGKSTRAKRLAGRPGAALVRLDDINYQFGAGLDEAPIGAEQLRRTYGEANRRLADHLLAGHSVIFDHGNFTPAERDQVTAIGASAGARVRFPEAKHRALTRRQNHTGARTVRRPREMSYTVCAIARRHSGWYLQGQPIL